MKIQTKLIDTLCPKHKIFRWGEWQNNCSSSPYSSNMNMNLVCANCESEITINDKAEKECKNCEIK